jgi:hypothetical protein
MTTYIDQETAHELIADCERLSETLSEKNELLSDMLAALRKLADSADDVGVKFFDTDTLDPLVEALQAATQAARDVIAKVTA